MGLLAVTNASSRAQLGDRIRLADTYLTRLRGLLGRKGWSRARAPDLPSRGVHMFGMRFPLDVLLLTRSGGCAKSTRTWLLERPQGCTVAFGLHWNFRWAPSRRPRPRKETRSRGQCHDRAAPAPRPSAPSPQGRVPWSRRSVEEIGLPQGFLSDLILRILYTRGSLSGHRLSSLIRLPSGPSTTNSRPSRSGSWSRCFARKGSAAAGTSSISPPRGAPGPAPSWRSALHRARSRCPSSPVFRVGGEAEHSERARGSAEVKEGAEPPGARCGDRGTIGARDQCRPIHVPLRRGRKREVHDREAIVNIFKDEMFVPFAVHADGR
jgi:hypothetical protein